MRERFLPVYLDTDVWKQLVEAVDEFMVGNGVDDAIRQLQLMRVPVNTGDVVFSTNTENGVLTRLEDVESMERDSVVKMAKLLGFNFQTGNLFQPEDYLRITQYISSYYSETKGTEAWQNFLSFCMNANFTVTPTWTMDYKTFVPEGDPSIGYPVWNGGQWYPTTTVILSYDPSKFSLTSQSVYDFFYYFANINLILEHIVLTLDGKVTMGMAMAGYITVVI